MSHGTREMLWSPRVRRHMRFAQGPVDGCDSGSLGKHSLDLTPLSPAERCSPLSVAAHTLYEETGPDRLPDPGTCWPRTRPSMRH